MTTVPARANLIQSFGLQLGPQARSKHRFWISVRVQALLDGYWQSRPSDAVIEEIMADWMDALETFSPDEIRKACRAYLCGPDRARKPKQGDIRALCFKARADANPAKAPADAEPERVVTPEEMAHRREAAARIMAEVWGQSDG